MSYPPYGLPDPSTGGEEPPYSPDPQYGAPQNPYGGSPYGAPNPYGGTRPNAPTDGVSIAGFVLSLLCCTGIVGLILGIVGLSRTKDGRRSGRWAAVAATVIGAIATVLSIAAVVGLVWVATNMVTPASAEVGQCVDVDGSAGDSSDTMWKKDCDEAHDAEVVATGTFSAETISDYQRSGDTFCLRLVASRYGDAVRSGDYIVDAIIDTFNTDDADIGDDYVCLARAADGSKLHTPITDPTTAKSADRSGTTTTDTGRGSSRRPGEERS